MTTPDPATTHSIKNLSNHQLLLKIVAYVEKNCNETEEVEEYLWKLIEELESE